MKKFEIKDKKDIVFFGNGIFINGFIVKSNTIDHTKEEEKKENGKR